MPDDPTNTVAEVTTTEGDAYLKDTLEFEETPKEEVKDEGKPEEVQEEAEEEPIEEKGEVEEEKLEELPAPDGKPRPTYKELTAKYPNLFKDFPSMRDMFFREAEYAKLYPNIEDAKEASEKAQDYEFLENLVAQGDVKGSKEFLGIMKENDEENFTNFSANFLPALLEVSPDLHNRITSPIIANVLTYLYREASNIGNENLKNSALHVAKAIFGDHRFATGEQKLEPLKVERKPDKEREELENEKRKLYTTMYKNFETDVHSSIGQSMRAAIANGLDPKNEIPEYLKNHIIKDTLDEIALTLESDASHMSNMNNLWRYADRQGFTSEARNKLVAAFITRGKILIPQIRGRIKSLALRGSAPEKIVRKEVTGESRGGSRSRHPVSAKEIDWSKTTDDDYINGKITYKGA